MNAVPYRIVPHDPWQDLDDDCGLPSIEERRRRSAANIAMLDALPPLPDPVVDEEAADRAMGALASLLLTDEQLAVIARQHRKFDRENGR